MKTNPNKKLASVCGLFCGSCGVYYATQEQNVSKLQEIAKNLGQELSATSCYGCRSNTKTSACKDCFIIKCAKKMNVDFCGECKQYPCQELILFQAKMPHRKNMWKSQKRINEVGWVQWFNEMVEYYSCDECKTINGAYDIECRLCGKTPSNNFVKENYLHS